MEILDVVDEYGEPTGERISREEAHRLGIRHRTSHVWIARKRNGSMEILLQKRSSTKDSYPGCYDISSAGHIPAGCSFEESAIRELQEELSVAAYPEQLRFCGLRSSAFDRVFYGKPFHDRSVHRVYLWISDLPEGELKLQESEIEEIRWMEYGQAVKAVKEDLIPNCIFPEELELLSAPLEQYRILTEQFEFRQISLSETDQAIQIENICFPPNEACSPRHMKERVETAPDLFLTAIDRETGRIAGFLNGFSTNEEVFRDEFFTDINLYDPAGNNVMLFGLDVLPQYRHKGLARELVIRYAAMCREAHRTGRLILTCLEDKVPMYRKMGFRDLGMAHSSWGNEAWHEMDLKL